MVVACPVCGKEFETRNSTIAHMSSSKGEHEGIGFQKANSMLDANGSVESATEPSEATSGEGQTLEVPGADKQPDMSDNSEHNCPECGAEAGDVSGLSDGELVECTDCGAQLRWEA